ncbi:MAG TPA: Na-translocating system protein MpsC family protein [Planctomycetaceae bacterium]|nr:Na-translocating system protein MpsC family protein [Planctomycetaceae bacterium]
MPTTKKTLRVLIVDDNRDGADALGLLVEALGNQVHVTYGGTQALDVAAAFRPDVMLVDLVMPGMNGCDLVARIRQMPDFARIIIGAITGMKDEGHKTLALKSGFDAFLVKPATLTEIKDVLARVVPAVMPASQSFKPVRASVSRGTEQRLPMEEARRIRNERPSKMLTHPECEAAICDGIARFQEEYLGWRSEQIQAHLIKDLLIVRIRGVLTLAEQQLGKSSSPEKGRDLIKQSRKQLLELARPMLESLVHEAAGVKVLSMHHDISTVTGEEMVVFSFAEAPCFQ